MNELPLPECCFVLNHTGLLEFALSHVPSASRPGVIGVLEKHSRRGGLVWLKVAAELACKPLSLPRKMIDELASFNQIGPSASIEHD